MLTDNYQENQLLSQSQLDRARVAMRRYCHNGVIACSTYGSRLRGYADPAADNDVVFLLRRPNSEFLGVPPLDVIRTYAEVTQENDRVAKLLTNELSWKISVTTTDERRLIIGIMQHNCYSISTVQSLSHSSKYTRDNLLPLFNQYFNASAAAARYLETAKQQINKLRNTESVYIYRQERNYLSAMWTIMRSLEYINEARNDVLPKPDMVFNELISCAAGSNHKDCPALEDETIFTPFYRRIGREAFDQAEPISSTEALLLEEFYRQAAKVVWQFTQYRPMNLPSPEDQARELLRMLVRNQKHFDEQE